MEDQPLSVIFALTPLEEIEEHFKEITASTRNNIRITPLSLSIAPDLVSRVSRLYRRAHPQFEPSAQEVQHVTQEIDAALAEGQDSPRSIVRGTVFLLDALRLRTAK